MRRLNQLRANRDKLIAERDRHVAEMEERIGVAEAGSRELTADESRAFDTASAAAEQCKAKLTAVESDIRREEKFLAENPQPTANYTWSRDGAARETATFITASGQPIRALSASDSMFASYTEAHGIDAQPADVNPGRFLQGLLTGNHADFSRIEAAATTTNDGPGGGYLVSTALSNRFIDLARSASVCMAAGATTIPMETGEMRLVRLTADPSAQWRGETVSVTASNPTFDQVWLRAKTLAAIVPVSVEMLEDSANARDVIESSIRSAMGLALDQAILTGSGAAAEPQGITSTSGVNSVASVGTPGDYADVTSAVKSILSANYKGTVNDLAWILHPRDAATYDGLADSTGQPLQPTRWSGALGQFYTTSLPTTDGGGSNESTMIVGSFPEVAVGMRTGGVVVRIIDGGTATDTDGKSWNGVTQLMRFIVVHMRADVAVLRPAWFTKLTGVTA